MYRLAASAVNHPDQLNQLWGVFNHRSLTALSRNEIGVTAAVPRPHAPPVGPFSEFRSIPAEDRSFPYPVSHPRFWYFLPKSLWYHRSGDSMGDALERWAGTFDRVPDIYHGCHLYPDAYALGTLSETHETPLTAYAHGTILNEYSTFNRGTRERIRTALQNSAVIFCSGADIEQKVQAIEPEVTTEVVPIGADPTNFPTDRQPELRQELHVPVEKTVVLFCGQFSREKGVADLLDVMNRVEDDSLYFVFIGHGGELRTDVHRALEDDGPPYGNALWKLHPVAVRRWFAVADLFVLPSYSEGRPTVVYEAMASKTPILATTVGGIPEQVVDGRTGWLLEPGDVSELQSRLDHISHQELQKMGRDAENRLREKGWTWEVHARRLIDRHRQILEDR